MNKKIFTIFFSLFDQILFIIALYLRFYVYIGARHRINSTFAANDIGSMVDVRGADIQYY